MLSAVGESESVAPAFGVLDQDSAEVTCAVSMQEEDFFVGFFGVEFALIDFEVGFGSAKNIV